jgi:hypothetical protein
VVASRRPCIKDTTSKSYAAREKSFSEVKGTVANPECEFVLFKQETLKVKTLKTLDNLNTKLQEKDNDITHLKQRVVSLETLNELLKNERMD